MDDFDWIVNPHVLERGVLSEVLFFRAWGKALPVASRCSIPFLSLPTPLIVRLPRLPFDRSHILLRQTNVMHAARLLLVLTTHGGGRRITTRGKTRDD